MTLLPREGGEVEALVTDRYLEALLRGPGPALALVPRDPEATTAALDDAVRAVSASLARGLPRFHPSFRFEERLALRLAEAAAAMRTAAAGVEPDAVPVPFPRAALDPLALVDDERDTPFAPRPLLIGGAVAASAISLAGAAWLAWRRSRGSGAAMTRAVRAAHATAAEAGGH
jgi:hypothetical protein